MALPVTALFAAIMGLWLVFLIFVVVRFRNRERVSLGTGGDDRGERLIRAHGNAAETAPIFLIMLGLSEGLGSPQVFLYIVGAAFCIGRLLHGGNFLQRESGLRARVAGMLLTLFPTILLSLDLLRHVAGL